MTLHRQPKDPFAEDVALEGLLPPGPPRRLADDELAALVEAVAMATVRRGSRARQVDIAHDLVLEVLSRRAEEPQFLANPAAIIPWVIRGVERASVKERRHVRWMEKHAPEIADAFNPYRERVEADVLVDEADLVEAIRRAINSLPSAMRQAFHLVREEGYSRSKAAELLGRSEFTVKRQMNDALRKLGAEYRRYTESANDKKGAR